MALECSSSSPTSQSCANPDQPVLLALPGPAFPKINWKPAKQTALAEYGVRFSILGTDLLSPPFSPFWTGFLEDEANVESESHEVKTAGSIWDCSLVLAKYVAKHSDSLMKGKSVLELGSGQGVVGLSCALAGAGAVTVTDVGPALPLLESNIALNGLGSIVAASELDWFTPDKHLASIPPAEVIVAADTVWVEDLVVPFVNTLSQAAAASRSRFGAVVVLFCHKTRSRKTDDLLFGRLREAHFSWHEVRAEQMDDVYRNHDLQLWRLELASGMPGPASG